MNNSTYDSFGPKLSRLWSFEPRPTLVIAVQNMKINLPSQLHPASRCYILPSLWCTSSIIMVYFIYHFQVFRSTTVVYCKKFGISCKPLGWTPFVLSWEFLGLSSSCLAFSDLERSLGTLLRNRCTSTLSYSRIWNVESLQIHLEAFLDGHSVFHPSTSGTVWNLFQLTVIRPFRESHPSSFLIFQERLRYNPTVLLGLHFPKFRLTSMHIGFGARIHNYLNSELTVSCGSSCLLQVFRTVLNGIVNMSS